MLPKVGDCCFVFDLRTGSLIIGVTCIVIGVLCAAGNTFASDDSQSHSQKLSGTVSSALYIVVGILIVVGVFLDILILVQIGAVVLLVVWILNFVLAVLVFLDNGHLANLVVELILLVVFIYFFIVLWSYCD